MKETNVRMTLPWAIAMGLFLGCANAHAATDAGAVSDAAASDAAVGDASCVDLTCPCDPTVSERQCPLGTGCPSGGLCLPGCDQDEDCGGRLRCNRGDLSCYDPAALIGSACTVDRECGVNGCATEAEGFPGGRCRGPICDLSLADCPVASACVPFGRGVGHCVAACTVDTDCRSGYRCVADTTTGTRVCSPACRSAADCAVTGACDAASGLCI